MQSESSEEDVENKSGDEECEDDDDSPLFMENDFDEGFYENETALPNPSATASTNKHAKIILTWLVYFVLIWQFKNYISDNAIEQLLKFAKDFLSCIAGALKPHMNVELILMLASNIPRTLYSARKLLNIDRNSFERYVVCPKCTKLYDIDNTLHNDGQGISAKVCNNIKYSRAKRPKSCGAKLVKEVILKNGTKKFIPLKTYCYKSLINSIESLLKRPDFEENCEVWKKKNCSEEHYGDVYDGNVWKSFKNWKGSKPFLELSRSFGLMLNVDWFQPYKHRNDISIGVIYLVLMNLPRKIRFRRENVILAGIIPAMKHEPKSLNYFLEPLVDELKALWTGVQVNAYNSPGRTVSICAALLCCAADVPAARKLCGFLGHQANRGCSHCCKFFPGGFGESKDYSGFEDRDHWPKRTAAQHRRDAQIVRNCRSESASEKKAQELGTRYTVLLELPYYSSVSTCVIDPVHNLFLGTAKRVFDKWVENGVISNADLKKIQERIELFRVPSDLGRLPSNIASNRGGYTASQWKNFVLLYSMYVLKGIVPQSHLSYWQSFVLGCKYLCQPCISKTDLIIADRKLLDFVKAYERENGNASVSPNMHLHMHIRESVQNFGSVYGFWLFSCERFNGILGAFHSNGREIEVQIMRKFTSSGILANLQFSLPRQYENYFVEHCQVLSVDPTLDFHQSISLTSSASGPLSGKESVWSDFSTLSILTSYKIGSLDNDSRNLLQQVYFKLYPQSSVELSTLFKKYSSVTVGGERYGSRCTFQQVGFSCVMASRCGADGSIHSGRERPGVVKYYIMHSAKVDGHQLNHMFAVTDWLKPSETDFEYANPLSVWYAKNYELPGPAIFLPVQRLHSRFVSVEEIHSGKKYCIVSPIYRRIYL